MLYVCTLNTRKHSCKFPDVFRYATKSSPRFSRRCLMALLTKVDSDKTSVLLDVQQVLKVYLVLGPKYWLLGVMWNSCQIRLNVFMTSSYPSHQLPQVLCGSYYIMLTFFVCSSHRQPPYIPHVSPRSTSLAYHPLFGTRLCYATERWASHSCIFFDENPDLGLLEHVANEIRIDERSSPFNAERDNVKVELMPCGHNMNGRNLIVCIDGTSNQFGAKVCRFRSWSRCIANRYVLWKEHKRDWIV